MHTVTITARPTAQAAGRTGPGATRDPGASACDPDTCPPITCRLHIDAPYPEFWTNPSKIVALAETTCDRPVDDLQEVAYLYYGNTIVDREVAPDDVSRVDAVVVGSCNAGSYTSVALTAITWPAGYVQTSGSNPLTVTGGPVSITDANCNTVTVPGVVGWDQTSAQQRITGAFLTVGNISYNYRCQADARFVVSQNPPGGDTALRGSAVNLEISTGTDANGRTCPRQ
jgi:hypothetical protein